MVRWVHGQGFRRLLFLNGHGGNNPAAGVLAELVNEQPGLKVEWYAWWVADSVQAVAKELGLQGTHANWLEAFPFCRVADMPPGVKPPTPSARNILNAEETKATYGDGAFGGGPYVVADALMQRIFDVAVQDIVGKLSFE